MTLHTVKGINKKMIIYKREDTVNKNDTHIQYTVYTERYVLNIMAEKMSFHYHNYI